jgi:CheY-like chemotaxis protein
VTFNASDAAIVQGMIALGHSLKLRMVAEGVETEAQMGYLRSIHCDEMQGFFYSRPLPSTDMYALLQSNKRLQDIAHTPGAVRKLLVVDDEPNITTALNRLLRREGYQILIAHSAREALEILAVNGDVGVVLSDQRMPEMSGIELLSKVKVLYPRIVRMILSGYTELSTVTEAINQGEIYRFLTKPWEDDQLREVVREAFQRFELAKAEQKSAAKNK